MDFQESPPVQHHQQEQSPTPHDPPSLQPHQQEQQQPPIHGHGTMAAPQPPPQPQTHQQENTNSNNLLAKIIFHQPQQQKKRGRSQKSFADGSSLSPTPIFEASGDSSSENPSKKSRGRPLGFGKKKKSEASVVNHADSGVDGDVIGVDSSVIPAKKPIGRPLWSKNKQKQQALGVVESKWTPHLISVQAGEDIVGKVITFSQQGPRPRVVCIISATGVACSVKIRESAIDGEIITYEGGQFEIISLSGSLFLSDSNDSLGISSGLSVLLSRPDGSNLCGSVAGMLKASSPVEIVVGSFIPEKENPMLEAPSSTC